MMLCGHSSGVCWPPAPPQAGGLLEPPLAWPLCWAGFAGSEEWRFCSMTPGLLLQPGIRGRREFKHDAGDEAGDRNLEDL